MSREQQIDYNALADQARGMAAHKTVASAPTPAPDPTLDAVRAAQAAKYPTAAEQGPDMRTSSQVALDQAQNVGKGAYDLITGLPSMAMYLAHLNDPLYRTQHPELKAPHLSDMAAGMIQPLMTPVQGLGALVAPNHVAAPTSQDWANSAQNAGANAATLGLGELAGGALKFAGKMAGVDTAVTPLPGKSPTMLPTVSDATSAMSDAIDAGRKMYVEDRMQGAIDRVKYDLKRAEHEHLGRPVDNLKDAADVTKYAADQAWRPYQELLDQSQTPISKDALIQQSISNIPQSYQGTKLYDMLVKQINARYTKDFYSAAELDAQSQNLNAELKAHYKANDLDRASSSKLPTTAAREAMLSAQRTLGDHAVQLDTGYDPAALRQRYGDIASIRAALIDQPMTGTDTVLETLTRNPSQLITHPRGALVRAGNSMFRQSPDQLVAKAFRLFPQADNAALTDSLPNIQPQVRGFLGEGAPQMPAPETSSVTGSPAPMAMGTRAERTGRLLGPGMPLPPGSEPPSGGSSMTVTTGAPWRAQWPSMTDFLKKSVTPGQLNDLMKVAPTWTQAGFNPASSLLKEGIVASTPQGMLDQVTMKLPSKETALQAQLVKGGAGKIINAEDIVANAMHNIGHRIGLGADPELQGAVKQAMTQAMKGQTDIAHLTPLDAQRMMSTLTDSMQQTTDAFQPEVNKVLMEIHQGLNHAVQQAVPGSRAALNRLTELKIAQKALTGMQ